MIFALVNGFSHEITFPAQENVAMAMKTVATHMAKHGLRNCMAYQLRNGELSGKGYHVFKVDGMFYYVLNRSVRTPTAIGKEVDLLG